jgi:hypothetical protein
MNSIKSKITSLIIFIAVSFLIAAPVERSIAERAARNWLNAESDHKIYSEISDRFTIDDAVHVFNFSNGGFVLIAADDASRPILGYSPSGKFINTPEMKNINFWIGQYIAEIGDIRERDLGNEYSINEWNMILEGNISKGGSKSLGPLMTTTWNQSPIYNMYCPMDGGSRSVVGCVATAMAQIMNYHKHPATGRDSHSYNILNQTLSVDYYLSRYDFDSMPDRLTSSSSDKEKHEVAQISYHAGVAVEMMYGSDGSGAYSQDVPYAMSNYFKYHSGASYDPRSSYGTAQQWKNMLTEQLDSLLPLYYSGYDPDGGHAFVCDGYQGSDYFHFNWGWGGYADGYFTVDALNPGSYAFNSGQAVVKNIEPDGISNLTLTNKIDDIQTDESSFQIVLSEHFSSTTGDVINYSIDPKSSMNGIQYNISNGILTFNRLSDGISRIVIIAETRRDNNFDEFYIQFGPDPMLAGFGNSYNFRSGSYLDAGTSSILNSIENIAFSAWIKLNSNGKDLGIVSKSSSSNTGWYVMIQNNNTIKFSVRTQEETTRRIFSNTAFATGQWYHLAVSYDGKDMYIYVNGETDNIKTTYTTNSPLLNQEAENLTIGKAYSILFDGQIDEAVLWNRHITLEDVRNVMNSRADTLNSAIVSYWPMDEGFFDSSVDKAGLHDGTLINNNNNNWSKTGAPSYFFTDKNTELNAALFGDDSDNKTYIITAPPSNGIFDLTDQGTGSFSYMPSENFTGTDEIKFRIDFGGNLTPEQTVYLGVEDPSRIDDENNTPGLFSLSQNYPNPFNPATMIKFDLNKSSDVKLSVYNISGQVVGVIAKGIKPAGSHSIVFDASGLNSGIYYYTLEVEGRSVTKKMLFVK